MEHSRGGKELFKEGGSKETMEEKEGTNNTKDRISELPDVILQNILAFVEAKDSARTTSLSKRWRSVWASLPILDFDETFWTSRKKFINYVDNLLQQRSEVNIQKFKLCLKDVSVGRHFRKSSQIDSWINFATKGNLEELDLNMSVDINIAQILHIFNERCKFCPSLPQSIFTTQSLTVLKLRRCKLVPSNEVNLPHLKTLSFEEIHAEEGIIQNLVSTCLLIETLILKGCRLEHFYCSNSQLQTLIVEHLGLWNKFDIDTPNLQSFSLTLFFEEQLDNRFQIKAERLKSLSLQQLAMTDEIFQVLIKLPLLENLEVIHCRLPIKLKFYQQNLRRLTVFKCRNLVEIGIDAPNLISFSYTGQILKISLMNTSCKLHAELCLKPILVVDSRWFSELREILGWFGHAQILTINFKGHKTERFIIPKEFEETSVPPLLDLKHLHLKTSSEPIMNYEELIDSWLWISPNIKTLSIDTGSDCQTLKFQPKYLPGDWEE